MKKIAVQGRRCFIDTLVGDRLRVLLKYGGRWVVEIMCDSQATYRLSQYPARTEVKIWGGVGYARTSSGEMKHWLIVEEVEVLSRREDVRRSSLSETEAPVRPRTRRTVPHYDYESYRDIGGICVDVGGGMEWDPIEEEFIGHCVDD